MECKKASLLLNSYIDGELDETTAVQVAEHISECSQCQDAMAMARSVIGAVRTHAGRERVPAYLRERIIARVDQSEERVWEKFTAWLPSFRLGPISSLALVGITAVALIAAGIELYGRHSVAEGQLVTISGRVECLDCTLAAEYGAHNDCAVHGHRNGIICSDGTMWTLMNNDKWWPYFHGERFWGKRVIIHGREFPDAHYVDINTYEFVDNTPASGRSHQPVIGLMGRLPADVNVVAFYRPY